MKIEIDEKSIENNKNKKQNENGIESKSILEQEVTEEAQNTFLESAIGKTINVAIDIGLRSVLPDMIEDQVVGIKNVLLKNGLKEGINTAIKSAIELGKSAMGIVTGKFEDLSQVHTAIKKGGIIDSVSGVIDTVLKSATQNEMISKGASRLIKKGKKVILDAVSNNIEEKYLEDVKSLEKVSKYISNWKNSYNIRDWDGMEKEYSKIKQQIGTIVALESTITAARKIETLHNLVKNKGIDYELSEEEKELVNILN